MKKIWFLCIAIAFAACSEQNVHIPNQIAGEIVNPTGDPVVLSQLLTPVQLAQGLKPSTDTLSMDSSRMASITKDYAEGYYALKYGNLYRTIYLQPGKTLAFKIDTKDKEQNVEYKGKMKLVSRYLQKKDKSIEDFRKKSRYYYNLDEEEFVHTIDSTRKYLDSLLVQFITNSPGFNETFLKRQAISNQYFIASYAYRYPRYAMYNHNDGFKVSKRFYENFDKLNINDPEGLNVGAYTKYLDVLVEEKVNAEYERHIEKYQNDDRAYYSIGLDVADSSFTNEAVRNYMAYSLMKNIIQYTAPDIAKEHLLYMNVNCTDSAYLASLNSSIAEWDNLKPGNPAPKFEYMDIDSQTVSLDQFKGKYVYVDVWATWCGPCKGEIPYLKNLEHKYKDKNIEFVSISLDKNVGAWRKMVQDKKLKGTQMFTGGWQTQLSKDYKINSIPRFILIDPDGQIIAARAKRPSSGIDKDLEALLN